MLHLPRFPYRLLARFEEIRRVYQQPSMTMMKNKAGKGWTHHSRVKKSGKTECKYHICKDSNPMEEKDEEKQQDYAQIIEFLGVGRCKVLVNDDSYVVCNYSKEIEMDLGFYRQLRLKDFVMIQFKNLDEVDVIRRYWGNDVWTLECRGELDVDFELSPYPRWGFRW